MYLWTCAHSEESDQPEHSYSLIKSFAKDAKFFGANDEDYDKAADLSLRWAHMPEGIFSHAEAYILIAFYLLADTWTSHPYTQ